MAKKPDKLALYDRLLAAAGDLAGKSNFGSAYTAVNGNMFSMISKHGVVGIRLPEAERAALVFDVMVTATSRPQDPDADC